MRNYLLSQSYYLKKDSTTKGICLLFLVASVALTCLIGSIGGMNMSSPLDPLVSILSFSLFLYFTIPIHACTFMTEGFVNGSVKNIIASGRSRTLYFIGKYISEVKIIIYWLVQLFGLYYFLFMIAAFVTQSSIGTESLWEDAIRVIPGLGFNFLYLSAYCAIVMMIGTLVRDIASVSIITFALIFGEFMMVGYFKDSPNNFLRAVSTNTLMAQVMKFSGVFVSNSKHIVLSGFKDYLHTAILPIIVIVLCLLITIVTFKKRDIQ